MYLTKDQLRKLRGIIYSRVSSGFEYHLCCQILDAYLCLFDVLMKSGEKFYPNVLFAKTDLECAVEFMIQHYGIILSEL